MTLPVEIILILLKLKWVCDEVAVRCDNILDEKSCYAGHLNRFSLSRSMSN